MSSKAAEDPDVSPGVCAQDRVQEGDGSKTEDKLVTVSHFRTSKSSVPG